MNLYENIKNNLKESEATSFFETTGLEIAQKYNAENANLNNCKEVSELVVNEAIKLGINCKVINVLVCSAEFKSSGERDFPYISPDNVFILDEVISNKSHYVIYDEDNNTLIDYTKMQYFGSNNPDDTKCFIAKESDILVQNTFGFVYKNVYVNSDDNKILVYFKGTPMPIAYEEYLGSSANQMWADWYMKHPDKQPKQIPIDIALLMH